MTKIDLHIHSSYSDDGELAVSEIVARCVRERIGYLSITDRNTVAALPELLETAARVKLKAIAGIELDCVYEGRSLRLLGYHFDYIRHDFAQLGCMSLSDGVGIIHEAGGIAVLAHPGQSFPGDYAFVERLVGTGIDGIEAYSSYHSRIDSVYYDEMAQRGKLLVTCGSDFYGKSRPFGLLCGHRANERTDYIIASLTKKGIFA